MRSLPGSAQQAEFLLLWGSAGTKPGHPARLPSGWLGSQPQLRGGKGACGLAWVLHGLAVGKEDGRAPCLTSTPF